LSTNQQKTNKPPKKTTVKLSKPKKVQKSLTQLNQAAEISAENQNHGCRTRNKNTLSGAVLCHLDKGPTAHANNESNNAMGVNTLFKIRRANRNFTSPKAFKNLKDYLK